MAYIYEYINKLEQYDTVKYTLKIIDESNNLPEFYIPILLNKFDDNLPNLNKIAEQMINNCNLENSTNTTSNATIDINLSNDINILEQV